MPFWRSRIIALYIDWVKTFACFRRLPYSDKVVLITNHASSYMIMCEAFRTPELLTNDSVPLMREPSEDAGDGGSLPSGSNGPGVAPGSNEASFDEASEAGRRAKPADTNIHTFFDARLIPQGQSCGLTGVRSLVDVPPHVHYPTVGNLSGLAPVMTATIDYVMKPFRRLRISTTEFATLQAIMFFDPGGFFLAGAHS